MSGDYPTNLSDHVSDSESERFPTNTANPNHNPTDPNLAPYTSEQWKDGHLADDIDPSAVSSDKWVDSAGRPFDPTAGSTTPTDGRCNAVLRRYEERCGEYRYCGQLPKSTFTECEHDYCDTHEDRASLDIKAEETLQTGMAAKSRDHVYRKLPDWQRLYIYGLFEGLMGESEYEYAPEYAPKEFDFSDCPFSPEISGQDGPRYLINVPHATESLDREVALWAAAVDGTKLELVNAEIAADEMSVETTDHAQLTSPTENDPTQEWKTLKTLKEHPLNMAYSRLIKDRKKLLQYGGIRVDGDISDDGTVVEELDSLTMVQADTSDDTPLADKAANAGIEPDDE